jgi:hypothetical protein
VQDVGHDQQGNQGGHMDSKVVGVWGTMCNMMVGA